jgi:CheY-like chemotaxis protein
MAENTAYRADPLKLRVVVADDDRLIGSLLDSRLTAMGCETRLAYDGAQAWQLILETNPNLAFIDLSMPEVDGYEVIERIRAHPRTKHLPVVVITSYNEAVEVDRAFASGATSFLSKPVRWSTFDSHVRYLLRLTQSAERSVAVARSAAASLEINSAIYRRTQASAADGMGDIRRRIALLQESIQDGIDRRSICAALECLSAATEPVEGALREAEEWSRVLASGLVGDSRRVRLSEILRGAFEVCRETFGETTAPISISEGSGGYIIDCDPDTLTIAVANLLDNAVRHADTSRSIVLEADIKEDFMLAISVHDDGAGICPDLVNAFMFPADARREDMLLTSNSIGLALTRAIIEAHGGRLEIRTSPGHGTSATLIFPPARVWFGGEAAAEAGGSQKSHLQLDS